MKSNHPTLLKRMRAERKRIAVDNVLEHAERQHLILEAIVLHHNNPDREDHCLLEDVKRMLGMSDEDFATSMNALVSQNLVVVYFIGDIECAKPTAQGVACYGEHHLLRQAYEHNDRSRRERLSLLLSVFAVIISLAALIRSFF